MQVVTFYEYMVDFGHIEASFQNFQYLNDVKYHHLQMGGGGDFEFASSFEDFHLWYLSIMLDYMK